MDNPNIKILIIAVIAISLFTAPIFALGVSSPYWDENPLKMHPGQTTEIVFTLLQSSEEASSAEVAVSLIKGVEIAKIKSGEKYTVSPNSRKDIIIEVSIPKNARIGETLNVQLSVNPAPKESDTGNIQLGVSYNQEFPVIVVDEAEALKKTESEKANSSLYLFALLIVAIIIVVIILVKRVRIK